MRPSLAVILALSAAACAPAGPPAPAAYPAPQSMSAERAFKAGFNEDLVAHPKEVPDDPKEGPNAANSWVFQAHNEQRIANDRAVRAYGALQSLNIKDCAWQRFEEKDLPRWSRTRMPKAPEAAYHCSYTLHYQINPPYGERFVVESEGAFFQVEGRYAYLGSYINPYGD